MRKRLNVRLLTRLAAVVVLLAVALHVVHLVQMSRHARNFLRHSKLADDESDLPRAALYLSRYLSIRPNDLEAETRYGLTLDRLAINPSSRWRAYHVLEKVLRRDPDNATVRQALGFLAVRLGKIDSAVGFLEPLRDQSSVDQAELEDTLAWCYLGQDDPEKAEGSFRKAIGISPSRVVSYENLARLLLNQGRRKQAEQVMDRLVEANPRSASAFLARAAFHERLQEHDDASADLARAVDLGPSDLVILLGAADFQRRHGRPDKARSLLEQGVMARQAGPRPRVELAWLERDADRSREALAVLRKGGDDPTVLALLAEILLEQGQEDEAARIASRLPEGSPWSAWVEAWRMLRAGEAVKAARRFEALTEPLADFPGWPARIQIALARCYAACGDAERQRLAAERAVQIDVGCRAARLALAQSLNAGCSWESACREWKALMAEAEPPERGWLGWARALTRRNMLSGVRADWPEVDRLLDRAERAGDDSIEVAIARVESLALRGDLAQAEARLATEATRLKDPAALQIAKADLLAVRGRFADALALVTGESPAARLARVRYAVHGGTRIDRVNEVLASATRDLDRLAPRDTVPILQTLAEGFRLRGDARAALGWCRRWCKAAAEDLRPFLLRAELGVRLQQENDVREAVAGLRRIEGDGGLRWRCAEASRVLLGVRAPDVDLKATLMEAWRTLVDADRLTRGTSAGRGLLAWTEGHFEELVGRTNEAITLYQRALEEGRIGETDASHLVSLLLERSRLVEADRVLRRCERDALTEWASVQGLSLSFYPLPTPRPLTAALARLGCDLAVRQKDFSRALELAPTAVAIDADSHLDLLWLAGIYEQAEKLDEATRILDRLTQRFGDLGESWVALVRHLVRAGRRDRAEDALARAQQRLSGIDDLWQLRLAECCEALGRNEQAERYYQLAHKAAPSSPLVRRKAAQFYLAVDQPEKAAPHLKALLTSPYESKDNISWARRQLASVPLQLLLLRREPPASVKPLLRDDDLYGLLGTTQPADLRARALVIAAQPGRAEDGLRRFEKTVSEQTALSVEERLQFAQLYDLVGERARANELMEQALSAEPKDAHLLAAQVRRLLRHEERGAARGWLKRLQELEPDSPRVRAFQSEIDG